MFCARVSALQKLSHVNVIRLLDVFEEETEVHLVRCLRIDRVILTGFAHAGRSDAHLACFLGLFCRYSNPVRVASFLSPSQTVNFGSPSLRRQLFYASYCAPCSTCTIWTSYIVT